MNGLQRDRIGAQAKRCRGLRIDSSVKAAPPAMQRTECDSCRSSRGCVYFVKIILIFAPCSGCSTLFCRRGWNAWLGNRAWGLSQPPLFRPGRNPRVKNSWPTQRSGARKLCKLHDKKPGMPGFFAFYRSCGFISIGSGNRNNYPPQAAPAALLLCYSARTKYRSPWRSTATGASKNRLKVPSVSTSPVLPLRNTSPLRSSRAWPKTGRISSV